MKIFGPEIVISARVAKTSQGYATAILAPNARKTFTPSNTQAAGQAATLGAQNVPVILSGRSRMSAPPR
jgi:hypothetical protein